ncbi:hypothetical protein ABIB26_004111 [Arthrobacter sp. UYEF20]
MISYIHNPGYRPVLLHAFPGAGRPDPCSCQLAPPSRVCPRSRHRFFRRAQYATNSQEASQIGCLMVKKRRSAQEDFHLRDGNGPSLLHEGRRTPLEILHSLKAGLAVMTTFLPPLLIVLAVWLPAAKADSSARTQVLHRVGPGRPMRRGGINKAIDKSSPMASATSSKNFHYTQVLVLPVLVLSVLRFDPGAFGPNRSVCRWPRSSRFCQGSSWQFQRGDRGVRDDPDMRFPRGPTSPWAVRTATNSQNTGQH